MHYSATQVIPPAPHWQLLQHPLLTKTSTELWLCQLETSIPQLSGNKWLKLQFHLEEIQQQCKQGIVTFGGAFSNHISAVAACCKQRNLRSVTYLRADTLDSSNPTLAFCLAQGMQFHLLDRVSYRHRHSPALCADITARHPDLLLVPEGGSSVYGVKGVSTLNLTDTPSGAADLIITATASGGTMAGIIAGNSAEVLGIAVVKDASLPKKISDLLPATALSKQWQVKAGFTGAGYARFDQPLLQFCLDMANRQVYIEPIYTGKALHAVFSMLQTGEIAAGQRLSFFHTGGLQGLAGLRYRNLLTAADYALLSGPMAD